MTLVVENKCWKSASASKLGRPHLNYDEGSQRLKRKLAFELSTEREHNIQLLVRAAAVSANKSNKSDMTYVLKECSSSSSRTSEIIKKLRFNEPLQLRELRV
uniref:UDP-glucuronosyltransferase 2A1 n=1 Tax=Zeugodacus cucurbitae TaxID=28588 RepID=A0A0A1XDW3_ZEUCU